MKKEVFSEEAETELMDFYEELISKVQEVLRTSSRDVEITDIDYDWTNTILVKTDVLKIYLEVNVSDKEVKFTISRIEQY